jgi:hypothetical protein
MIHKIDIGKSYEEALTVLSSLYSAVLDNKTFKFETKDGELIFVANVNQFMYAFIEFKGVEQ